MLYDQFGREVPANAKPILNEVAVQTVQERFSSYPSAGLTPERLATILRAADYGDVFRQAELFEEMEEKDLRLASDIQTRKQAVAGLDWEVLPASDSAEDKKIAAACEEMFDYFESFEDSLNDLLDAVSKGFSMLEIFWEIAEGQAWIKRLKWIHQKRFTFSGRPGEATSPGAQGAPPPSKGDFGRLLEYPRLLTYAEPVWGEELPPYKFIFHRHKARSGTANRGGIARPITYAYLFKNYNIKDWAIFNDLFAVPMRIGKYQAGAQKQDVDALKQAVFNLGTDAAAVISDATIIELLESKARGDVSRPSRLGGKYSRKAWLRAGSARSAPGSHRGRRPRCGQ